MSVIPGITAALGCASSAGLSLTKRGVSRAVTFVTAHAREGDATEPDWARLADPKSTLAIYMGHQAARRVGRGLMAGGLSPDTPVLAVENGCRPDEATTARRWASWPSGAWRRATVRRCS
ncbi:uroporphyrinogen-III C-methyltransferase [Azospirillum brasilense]|uniref:uroporphyrinogen-III C-methyltransferase n=1 Tax=Azospirillum brasilense TaxID=192 RepID=UPI0020005560|nr:SAM-dependent methyltransferase [Azospirillum brasilense]